MKQFFAGTVRAVRLTTFKLQAMFTSKPSPEFTCVIIIGHHKVCEINARDLYKTN